MTAPSPEAPPVPSALEPRPEGPSPRWRRAAQGLRWMRLATYTGVTTLVLATLWSLVGDRTPPASVMAGDLLYALSFLAYVAFAAGLWRYRSVPACTGAARPARQAFACLACGVALYLLCYPALALLARVFGADDRWLLAFVVLCYVAVIALNVACSVLLVRALGATLRSLGEAPPAWVPMALVASIALPILLIAVEIALLSFATILPRVGLGLVLAFGLAAEVAVVLALAAVMGFAARALARQESPENALR